MRTLDRAAFADEAGVSLEVVERLIAVAAIVPRDDGRLEVRDEAVAATAQSLVDAGIPLDALADALAGGRFGLRSLGALFLEPSPRTPETYREVAGRLGADAAHLAAVYAALGLPEPDPDDHPRADEIETIAAFVGLWSLVDPTGSSHVRVARLIGDGTRRIAETTLDVWDEVAQPDSTTQGAPTVGPRARPADPSDPEANVSVRMAELARRLVGLAHERHVEATLNARILAAIERVLVASGTLIERPERPPAIAFIDLAGFTSLTVEHGDDAAASAATRLFERSEPAVQRAGGRVVKQLGDGVLLRFPDSASAIRAVLEVLADLAAAGLGAHAGIAAGPVIVRDGDVYGRTVNLAARIADRAATGQILVEEGVVVALPRGIARFKGVGRVELQGFPDPIALWSASAAR